MSLITETSSPRYDRMIYYAGCLQDPAISHRRFWDEILGHAYFASCGGHLQEVHDCAEGCRIVCDENGEEAVLNILRALFEMVEKKIKVEK